MRFCSIAGAIIFAAVWGSSASGFQLGANGSLLQLPASSYHYLGYDLHAGFGTDRQFVVDLGLSQPFSGQGLNQVIVFGTAGIEWILNLEGTFKPYMGVGAGVYGDLVGTQAGWVPSIVFRGGLRVGGKRFGVDLGLANYVGIFDLSQLVIWTVWPLFTATAGIYVAF